MGKPSPNDTDIEKQYKNRMSKPDELIDIKMIEGTNWKTDKPNSRECLKTKSLMLEKWINPIILRKNISLMRKGGNS